MSYFLILVHMYKRICQVRTCFNLQCGASFTELGALQFKYPFLVCFMFADSHSTELCATWKEDPSCSFWYEQSWKLHIWTSCYDSIRSQTFWGYWKQEPSQWTHASSTIDIIGNS